MREPGFYWVKYKDRWIVAECVIRWPSISDGSNYRKWLIPGKKKERNDSDFEKIESLRLMYEIEISLGRKIPVI